MTRQNDFTLLEELLEQIAKGGYDIFLEKIRIVISAAMQAKRK